MKREELKGFGLTDEQIDKVMAVHGTDVNTLKATIQQRDEQITTLTTERDGLKNQVADRDNDIATLQKSAGDNEQLRTQLTELQTKYDQDTTKLQQTLDQQARDFAVESLYSGVEFTSAYAKRAAIAEFKAGNHEFKDGKFVGADEIIKKQRGDNPDAFKTIEERKTEPEKKKPQFTDPKPAGDPKKTEGSTMPLGFHFVRNPPKQE